MEYTDIIDAVVGPDDYGKCKTTFALFVEEWPSLEEKPALDEFFCEKPIIDITEYNDGEDDFYCFEFIYKSRRDEDLTQQWNFLNKFVKLFANVPEDAEAIPVLVLNLMPTSLNGKYSIFARPALPDSITWIQYAGEDSCSIKMACLKQNVFFLEHDDDLIDRRAIEVEAMREVTEELEAEYGIDEIQ